MEKLVQNTSSIYQYCECVSECIAWHKSSMGVITTKTDFFSRVVESVIDIVIFCVKTFINLMVCETAPSCL